MNLCYKVPMRFLIILSVLVLASCTKKEPEPAEPEAATQAEATAEAPSEEQAAEGMDAAEAAALAAAEEAQASGQEDWGELGVATLLEPGKAPLRKLRHTFKQGDTAKVELQVTADRGQDEEGAPFPLLGARYLVSFKTNALVSGGTKASVGFTIEAASPIGQDEDPTAAQSFAALEGVQGSYTVDSLGVITDFKLAVPEDAHNQTIGAVMALTRMQALMSIPVPAEEVGVGARWTFVREPEGKTKKLLHKTTYEVTKIKGSKVKVSMSLQLGSTAPELDGEVKWLGAWGTGQGAASFNLTGVAPARAKMDVERSDKYFILAKGSHIAEIKYSSQLTAK
jgi:hypothetical protein